MTVIVTVRVVGLPHGPMIVRVTVSVPVLLSALYTELKVPLPLPPEVPKWLPREDDSDHDVPFVTLMVSAELLPNDTVVGFAEMEPPTLGVTVTVVPAEAGDWQPLAFVPCTV